MNLLQHVFGRFANHTGLSKKAVLLFVLFSTMSVCVNAQSKPSFVPGELLIRYHKDTDGNEAVEKAGKTIPLDIASLTPEMDKLSADIGIPLEVASLNSGGWLTLAINATVLNTKMVEHLRGHTHVASVEVPEELPAERGWGGSPVFVTFKAGTKEAQEAKNWKKDSPGRSLKKLAEEIEKQLDVPISLEAGKDGMLAVHVNMSDLTLIAVDHLQNLSIIEYVQPNYTMGY